MLKKISRFFDIFKKELSHRSQCKDCNCGAFDGPNYPDDEYCSCGHHYDRHEY